jgi:ornithine cyclodeaminase
MRILTGEQLTTLLPASALIAAVEQSLRALIAQQVSVPARQHVQWQGGTLLVMPAVGAERIGVKLVSVVPGNAGKGVPVTSGLMVLLDAQTGQPTALLDAAMLTARRTGAVGALSLQWMTPPTLDSIGIIGTGVQGAWQAISACAVRPIKAIYYLARSAGREEQFVRTVQNHVERVRLVACPNARALLQATSTVIAATTSIEPVLPDDPQLLEGKHFASVGSFTPTMQELPLSVYRLAGQLVIDSEAARHEAGDVINPVKAGTLEASDVFHLSELVSGTRAVDVSHTTVFKSVGLALYDLFVAQALLEAATRLNVGQVVEF